MRVRSRATVLATLVITGVVLGVLLVCIAFGPAWIVGDGSGLTAAERLGAENDVRSTLLQGFVGLLALGGAVLGAAVTLDQVRANRAKHATDLYVKAIELLASDQLSIRHGAVYALEQLTHLDVDESYRGNVHALLTAFIRQRAPWPPETPDAEPTTTRPLHGGAFDDVGAGLGVLSRHATLFDGYSELERVDLRGAELDHLNLTNSCFAHSNLAGASLTNTTLTGSTLTDTILRNANLTQADLSGADLSRADLTGADLDGAILTRADLTNAQLDDTNLHGVTADHTTSWPHGFTPPQPTA